MERSLKKKRSTLPGTVLPDLLKLSENGDVSTDELPLPDPSVNDRPDGHIPRFPLDEQNDDENGNTSDDRHADELKNWSDSLASSEPAVPLGELLEQTRETDIPEPAESTDPTENLSQIPKLKNGPFPSDLHSGTTMIAVSGLHKGYVKGKKLIPVLQGIDMEVAQGEYLSIVGQSGSGKSTLLHLMGTLDVPDQGTIHFSGQRIDNLPSVKRDYFRNYYIGMIFQFYHLIPEMTTLENVLAPLMIRDSFFQYLSNRRKYRQKAEHLLELVGLTHRLRHRPSELSGGEMQRASIARALIGDPSILLADEPTGNLDSKTSQEIIKLLRGLNEKQNLTIVMVTHDLPQARDADRIIRLVDGQIVSE